VDEKLTGTVPYREFPLNQGPILFVHRILYVPHKKTIVSQFHFRRLNKTVCIVLNMPTILNTEAKTWEKVFETIKT